MPHLYNQYIDEWLAIQDRARALPLGGLPPATGVRVQDNAPRVLVLAPHPDDECITGALALRLHRERGFRVSAVPVTLGSRVERQTARLEEMHQACHFLGFEVIPAWSHGLDGQIAIHPRTRDERPEAWAEAAAALGQIIAYHRPAVLVLPHAQDFQATHIGTHLLGLDALRTLGPAFHCQVVETEFWQPLAAPNLMLGCAPGDLADLVAALSFHAGEVRRNPYHVSLPAWMADNVRRGSELVGGQGAAAGPDPFATLYRIGAWAQGGLVPLPGHSRQIASQDSLASLFP